MEEWTLSESLRKHALAVEACTRGYGEREADRLNLMGEEREAFALPYSLAGLLHDSTTTGTRRWTNTPTLATAF